MILGSSKMPAAPTAGIDSRNEKRAAASRRMPSAIAASSVIPERDTPGTSASACAQPIRIASRRSMLSRSRPCAVLAALDPGQRQRHDDERDGDDPERAERALDRVPQQQADHADRDRADDQVAQVARVDVGAACPTAPAARASAARSMRTQLAEEEDDHRRQRAELQDRGEGRARVVPAERSPARCAGGRSTRSAGTRSPPAPAPGSRRETCSCDFP